jgi:arginine/ornithine transport system permease protein
MHSTAVASTITVVDILGAGRKLNASYYLAYEGFITAAVLYVTIAFSASYGFKALEKRFLEPLTYR